MAETIELFGLEVYGQGLFAALGALAFLVLTFLFVRRKNLPSVTAPLLTVFSVLFGVILGRLLYCAVNLTTFTEEFENPALMLRFWDGGMSLAGATAGIVLVAAVTAALLHVPFSRVADLTVVPLGLTLAMIRFGEKYTDLGNGKSISEGWMTEHLPNLFEVTKMGKNMDWTLAASRYQAFACLILFAVTLLLFLHLRNRDGETALLFFALYGASEILLESLLDDGHMTMTFLRVGQLAGAVMTLVPLGVLCCRYRRAGGSGKAVLLAWLAAVLGAAGIVLIEFALDGRLSIGSQSMGVNYLFEALCCILIGALSCLMTKAIHRLEVKT